jgi:hypothetical protein
MMFIASPWSITNMNLHIGENQTVLQAEMIAILPLFVDGKEQSSIFLADGTVVLSLLSACTLQKRINASITKI